MSWKLQRKTISIVSAKPHHNTAPRITGRTPAISAISFTPAEMFGAAARCSHLHVINPAVVTPESQTMTALIAQYVDDTTVPFGILDTAKRMKDFVGTHFTGTVAAALAYLAMIKDGYVWSDHFENIRDKAGGGNPAITRTPDFVFARDDISGVALVESKGTRGTTSTKFDGIVKGGYKNQIEPHLGYSIGTSVASHGYCIGAYMTSPAKADLYVHHTAFVPAATSTAPIVPAMATVQQQNFATAFQLAHGTALARQIRNGRIDSDRIEFVMLNWLGHQWLSRTFQPTIVYRPEGIRLELGWPQEILGFGWPAISRFAIEKNRAVEVLRQLSAAERISELRFDLSPIPNDLRELGREFRAAVFPDGLAALTNDLKFENVSRVYWDRRSGQLLSDD